MLPVRWSLRHFLAISHSQHTVARTYTRQPPHLRQLPPTTWHWWTGRSCQFHRLAINHYPPRLQTSPLRHQWCLPLILPAGLFSLLAPRTSDAEEAESTPEGKLILCIKRSVLCIQRQQYDKAEQMLHLALRMAQDQRHAPGVTYVFDVMANLALERGQYAKAQRLFVTVMQHLLQEGRQEDDIKVSAGGSALAE